jgi:hypothetical protein
MYGEDPIVSEQELLRLKKDAGLDNMPTQDTYHYRMAMSNEGPRAYDWSDKPHRLIYDLCGTIEEMQVQINQLISDQCSYRH